MNIFIIPYNILVSFYDAIVKRLLGSRTFETKSLGQFMIYFIRVFSCLTPFPACFTGYTRRHSWLLSSLSISTQLYYCQSTKNQDLPLKSCWKLHSYQLQCRRFLRGCSPSIHPAISFSAFQQHPHTCMNYVITKQFVGFNALCGIT